MRLRPFESRLSVIRLDYGVAVFLKKLPSQAAHDFVVFHEQDRPLLFRTNRLCFGLRSDSDLVFRAGEVNLERRSVSRFAVDQNVSPAVFDNSIDSGEAQAGSFAYVLGREERFEDARYSCFI